MTLGECPIHWVSRLQTEIALSTCESEYIALAQAMRDFIPIRHFYDDMILKMNLKKEGDSLIKSQIFEDNNACISVATDPAMSSRTKHIAVKYHFVRQFFTDSQQKRFTHSFALQKIDSKIQKADIFI